MLQKLYELWEECVKRKKGGSGKRGGGGTHDTHALPCRNQRRNADNPSYRRQSPVAASGAAQGDENGGDEAQQDGGDAETTGEDDARSIAVADGPADEVRVGLTTE